MRTSFALPDGVEAAGPPTARDAVRLLVAAPGRIEHARFTDLGRFLQPGDLVVVNTSATLAAAVDGRRADGRPVTVHFATALDGGGTHGHDPSGLIHGLDCCRRNHEGFFVEMDIFQGV